MSAKETPIRQKESVLSKIWTGIKSNKGKVAISLFVVVNIGLYVSFKLDYDNSTKIQTNILETISKTTKIENTLSNSESNRTSNIKENINRRTDLSVKNFTFTDDDKKILIKYLQSFIDYDLKMLAQDDQRLRDLDDQKIKTNDKDLKTEIDELRKDINEKRTDVKIDLEYQQNSLFSFFK